MHAYKLKCNILYLPVENKISSHGTIIWIMNRAAAERQVAPSTTNWCWFCDAQCLHRSYRPGQTQRSASSTSLQFAANVWRMPARMHEDGRIAERNTHSNIQTYNTEYAIIRVGTINRRHIKHEIEGWDIFMCKEIYFIHATSSRWCACARLCNSLARSRSRQPRLENIKTK